MKEAVKNRVLPIDDRGFERLNAKLVGRPDVKGDRTSLTLYFGMKKMSENVFIKRYRDTWSWIDDGGWKTKRALTAVRFFFTLAESGGNEELRLTRFRLNRPNRSAGVGGIRVGRMVDKR